MNRKRMVLPAAACVVLLGVGVYFSGGDLAGDASGAGCGTGEVVDVQQDIGDTDAGLDAELADLASWDAARLADPMQRPEFDRRLGDVIDEGPAAVPSLITVIQTQGCNEPASGEIIGGLHKIIIDDVTALDGRQGIASVLVTAATQGLLQFDLPEAAPTFSEYPEIAALADQLRVAAVGFQPPDVDAWIHEPGRREQLAEDDGVTRCSLAALDATVSLMDSAAFDRLIAALGDVPAGHPAGLQIVEAALELQSTRTGTEDVFRTLALDPELHPDARGMACWAAGFEKEPHRDGETPLEEVTADQRAHELAACSAVATVSAIGVDLARDLESSNNAMVRTAAARAVAREARATELESLIDSIINRPVDMASVCGLEGVLCDVGQLTIAVDTVVDLIAEDPDAEAELRARLEVAVADATPDVMARIRVLARAGEELWTTPIPGLEL